MTGRTCSEYCAQSGFGCAGAWEEVANDCNIKATLTCDEVWPGTSDLVCECASAAASGSEDAPSTSGPTNSESTTCTGLSGVKATCSDNGCKVLAGGMTGRTCSEYCAQSGFGCAGAWEEVANDCNIKATLTCDEVWPGTSDLICECERAMAAAPSEATVAVPLRSAWVHYEGYNCFGGHGAIGVPNKNPVPGDHFLPTCKEACEAEPECEGIVMVRETQPYKCWLVKDLNPMACFENTDYDMWQLAHAQPNLNHGSVPATRAPSPTQANVYEQVGGVGAWGGWCTCPDGQRYNVGDLFDGCANGPQSLACFGGTPGECVKVVDETRSGMKVICAA